MGKNTCRDFAASGYIQVKFLKLVIQVHQVSLGSSFDMLLQSSSINADLSKIFLRAEGAVENQAVSKLHGQAGMHACAWAALSILAKHLHA